MKPSLALIGPGKLGCAVARRLQQTGYPLLAVVGREQQRARDACRFIGCAEQLATTDVNAACQAEVLLLAVPDDRIATVARELQPQRVSGKTLLHFSGLQPASCMRVPGSNASLLSLHPLLPFADRQRAADRLTGCPCALEGDPQALPLGEQLVAAFQGQAFHIDSAKKGLYHAAACIASNYLVTLQATAQQLLSESGVAAEQAGALLQPLLRATLNNLTQLGPAAALTGPIVRGDAGTVAQHLQELAGRDTAKQLYRLLGRQTLELAQNTERLTPQQAEPLRQLLDQKKMGLSRPHQPSEAPQKLALISGQFAVC